MKKIQPGIYREFPIADYYADPAPSPSLTQSLAKIIIEQSPLHAWHAHPRLNPAFERDDPTKYDVGNIAHALMIGRGKDLIVLDAFDDWRTNAAKAEREQAREEGKLAVLGKHFELGNRMVEAAHAQLTIRGEVEAFRIGAGEVVMLWQEAGIWCRQMLDWLTDDHKLVCDYKTTGMNAAPHRLGRMMADAGWHIQAAMAERGLLELSPRSAGRRRYVFVVQETDPPYAINVAEIGEGPMTMGRKQLNHAVDLWSRAIATSTWPAYPLEIQRPEFPGYAETEWLNREVEYSERVPRDLLAAG